MLIIKGSCLLFSYFPTSHKNWSLLLDIRIIFMTVWNALRQDENAY